MRLCPAEAVVASPIGPGVWTALPCASSSTILWQDRRGESRQEGLGFRQAPPRRRKALSDCPVKLEGMLGEAMVLQDNVGYQKGTGQVVPQGRE